MDEQLTSIEWTGLALMVFGAALIVVGVWLKAGPELAVMAAGLISVAIGSYAFRNSVSD